MNIDIGSFAYGGIVLTGGNTPSWGTALGQSHPDYKFTYPGAENILIGMMYCSIPLQYVSLPLGKGGRVNIASEIPECQLASLFKKVYINEIKIDYPFIMVLIREESASHTGRRTIKYSDKTAYNDGISHYNNQQFVNHARLKLGLADEACWFIYNIEIRNQDELHMYAAIVDANNSVDYPDSQTRRKKWLDLLEIELKKQSQAYTRVQYDFCEDKPLQQIYYGAPGTGKSNIIKETTEKAEKEGRVFRTTFHPDSDYSTFVGCYKPTKAISKRLQRMNLSLEDLAKELGSYYSNEEFGKIGGIQKFCFEYYPYIDGEYMSVNVTKLLELAGVPKDYNVEINKYIKFCHLLPKQDPDKITYEFVPQAFTNAYVKAWNTDENVYLIIEEINRGNCAQIFGDLFQLLDRKNGISEYPIDADNDLGNYLMKELADSTREDFPVGVKEGKKLVLPSNLYIWATMNTSDQSLFPIDSAFKRRWDWQYMPIENAGKDWKIEVNGHEYDWYLFLEAINKEVLELTHSEDKQLGYFFAKAVDGKIDAKTLVNKVYFYLWTDVFKDYEYESLKAFKKAGSNDAIAFKNFFHGGGVDEVMAEQVLINLELNKPQESAE